ncbi:hypothetical protein CCR75_008159 [Bremia lactucae]|uniref:JmjC domain-containing protein n=1 Tax=Bremia lactucae TaxID=4779 RepID=A0A976IC73_BRELC|nr:hypothetical protein CCR75_008159 [Bremia lactucae]
MNDDFSGALRRLQSDTHDYWAPIHSVCRVDASRLTPFQFYRDYVSRNVPVVLLNAMTSPTWQRAMANWQNDDYLVAKSSNHPVTVDVTPTGLGDAVITLSDHDDGTFVMPEERSMSMSEFLKNLKNRPNFDGVPYLSHQNDSLRTEFPKLFEDVPSAIELAVLAFGNEPEAVNLWIGDERAVSSMHKDHYENFYCVVKGQKIFTLLPPSAIGCLYERDFASARYRHVKSPIADHLVQNEVATMQFQETYPQYNNQWTLMSSSEMEKTPWIPVDPLNIDAKRYPLAATLHPVEVKVSAGELLYLPSLWYHRVAQVGLTISVNYWHDMEFNCQYVYYNFVRDIGTLIQAREDKSCGKTS